MSDALIENANLRLCPDLKKDDEFYKVKNAYSNETLRNSFSVEIVKCSEQISNVCKTDEEVRAMLK